MAVSKHETRFILTGKDKTKAALGGVKALLKGIGGSVTSLQGKLVSLAGIGGFGLLLKGLVSTNAAFQTMKSSLKTVTGSAEAANKAFDQIEQFAVSTPFELDEVVQSFIKLKALGLDPSEEALRSYGNTASALGKSLDQMIEAVADAATGEFERLKEFGIRAKKQGDEVSFTFQGVTTTIGNSAAEITGYLQSIGTNQFGSAMADQMGNLTPAFSNLSAALKGIQVNIGEAGLNDLIAGMANSTTDFIKSLDKEQIQAFTQAALSGFADLIDSVDSAVNYLNDNPHLIPMGLVGYLMFGKKGIAAVGVLEWAANQLGRTYQMAQQQFAPLPGAGAIGRGATIDPNYRLGSFNDAQGPADFKAWTEAITGQQAKPDPQLTEQTTLLKEIADRLRDQTSVAVAG